MKHKSIITCYTTATAALCQQAEVMPVRLSHLHASNLEKLLDNMKILATVVLSSFALGCGAPVVNVVKTRSPHDLDCPKD